MEADQGETLWPSVPAPTTLLNRPVLVVCRGEAALRSPRISIVALIAFLAVLNAPTDAQVPHSPPAKTKTYYIAADEVV
jgi:hypothetical protein